MKHNYKIRLHSWVWDLHVHTAIFKMDNQQGPTYCVAQETLLNVRWQPRTEGSLGENGYMYVYGWVTLLSTWNYPNIVNQLLNWIELKVTQSCPTLWDPIDYTVHGILQARILEWVFPSPGDLPNPGIKPRSPALQADSLPTELSGKAHAPIQKKKKK